jgi:uncharacterized protein involved in exopolysaccharide biosynthesis
MNTENINQIQVGNILWRYKGLIISSALFCGIIALIISYFIPKIYEAKATLLIMPPKFQTDVQPTAFTSPTYQGLLESRELVKEIIEQLQLKNITVEELTKKMKTKVIFESQPKSIYTPVIYLLAESDTPQSAAAIANKWAELFVGRTEHLSSREIDKAYQLLTTQLDSTKYNLLQAEEAVKRYKDKYKLENRQSELASILQQLNGLSSGILSQPRYSQFLPLNPMTISVFPEVKQELPQGYRGLYVSLLYSYNTTENLLKQSGSQLSPEEKQRLQKFADTLNIQINELVKTIQQLEQKEKQLSETINIGETELLRLQREADRYKKTYDLLSEKAEQAKIAKSEQVEDVKIFAKAVIPEQHIWPRKGIISIIAFLVGFFISAGFVLTKEYFKTA